jgi:hypothetical protein
MQLQTVLLYSYNMMFITIFKIKKFYVASGSAPPPHKEKFWVRPCWERFIKAEFQREFGTSA